VVEIDRLPQASKQASILLTGTMCIIFEGEYIFISTANRPGPEFIGGGTLA